MDFDPFAPSYDELLSKQLGFFARERSFFHARKVAQLRTINSVGVQNVLDYGCGVGGALPSLRDAFPAASIFGFDPSDESRLVARRACPWARFPDADDLRKIPFDVIYMACVMHHVPPSGWLQVIQDAKSLLAPGGVLSIFEHNPWNPITQWMVHRCPFDADAVLIRRRTLLSLFRQAGMKVRASGYFLVFPERLSWLSPLERLVSQLPVGGQYVVVGSKSA